MKQSIMILVIVAACIGTGCAGLPSAVAKPVDYAISAVPIDPQANDAARRLLATLASSYGTRILSGYSDGTKADMFYAGCSDGRKPAIVGYDFSPFTRGYTYRWHPNGYHTYGPAAECADIIKTVQTVWKAHKGQIIIQFQWHWCAPVPESIAKAGFDLDAIGAKGPSGLRLYGKAVADGAQIGNSFAYPNPCGVDFDPARAVLDGTPEHADAIKDIDSVAEQLLILQKAGIPVLFRPLHEGAGNVIGTLPDDTNSHGAWFWWGSRGSAVYKQLWAMVYHEIVEVKGVHNCVWVWSDSLGYQWDNQANKNRDYVNTAYLPERYDVAGIDVYRMQEGVQEQDRCESNKALFDQLYQAVGGKKVLALCEVDCMPDPDACFRDDARWAYGMVWEGFQDKTSKALISRFYASPHQANRGDLSAATR